MQFMTFIIAMASSIGSKGEKQLGHCSRASQVHVNAPDSVCLDPWSKKRRKSETQRARNPQIPKSKVQPAQKAEWFYLHATW